MNVMHAAVTAFYTAVCSALQNITLEKFFEALYESVCSFLYLGSVFFFVVVSDSDNIESCLLCAFDGEKSVLEDDSLLGRCADNALSVLEDFRIDLAAACVFPCYDAREVIADASLASISSAIDLSVEVAPWRIATPLSA